MIQIAVIVALSYFQVFLLCIQPNKSKKENSNITSARNDLTLPESILEAARGLVIKKNTITEEQEMKKKLFEMERTMKLLADQQNYVITLLKDIKS